MGSDPLLSIFMIMIYLKRKIISIETLAGIKYITIETDESGKANMIKVDMGEPIFEGSRVPITIDKEKGYRRNNIHRRRRL